MIYRTLLALYPARIRKPFAAEMLAVHRLAAKEAFAAGCLAYLSFQVREIAGLVFDLTGEVSMKHVKWIAGGALLGLGITAASLHFVFEEQYRSTAVLHVNQGALTEQAMARPLDLGQLLQVSRSNLLSRASLKNIIETHGLYPGKLKRKPLEEVVESMRDDIQMQPALNDAARIAFRYPDPAIAQRVLQDLIGRIIQENSQLRLKSLATTEGFLRGQLDAANVEWIRAEEVLKKGPASGNLSRLSLDADLARERYRSIKNQLADVQRALAIANWKMGPELEMLDPPSLSQRPENKPAVMMGAGAIAGAAAGFLISYILALLSKKPEPAIA